MSLIKKKDSELQLSQTFKNNWPVVDLWITDLDDQNRCHTIEDEPW